MTTFGGPGELSSSPGDTHEYAPWDAAYVLGSLSFSERREFEAHLSTCPSCREAVSELSGMPALLAQLDRDYIAWIDERGAHASAALPPLRPELLASLLAKVSFASGDMDAGRCCGRGLGGRCAGRGPIQTGGAGCGAAARQRVRANTRQRVRANNDAGRRVHNAGFHRVDQQLRLGHRHRDDLQLRDGAGELRP
jgi:anti-sigma factor RsiW